MSLHAEPVPPDDPRPVSSTAAEERRGVRRFYDEIGWSTAPGGTGYQDAHRFDDLREATAEYIHACHRRVGDGLAREGVLFLDAASGAVQFPEYLEYSRGFRYRVCVDLSRQALREASARLGAHGLCVMADVARLPFRPGTFGAGVSLSTIYHVPAEDQGRAFQELARVAAPGGRIAVAYSWGKYSALMLIPDAVPTKLGAIFSRLRHRAPAAEPPLHFCPRSPLWFRREVASRLDYEMRVWRSVSVSFLRWYVPGGAFGRAMLRVVFALEQRFPRLLGWLGQYPLIVIRGREGPRPGPAAAV